MEMKEKLLTPNKLLKEKHPLLLTTHVKKLRGHDRGNKAQNRRNKALPEILVQRIFEHTPA